MGNKCDRLMSQYPLRSQSCVSSESKDMDENTTNTEIREADALTLKEKQELVELRVNKKLPSLEVEKILHVSRQTVRTYV